MVAGVLLWIALAAIVPTVFVPAIQHSVESVAQSGPHRDGSGAGRGANAPAPSGTLPAVPAPGPAPSGQDDEPGPPSR